MARRKNGVITLTGRQIEHLLFGWCLGAGRKNLSPFESEAHRREAWFEHRDYILSLEGIERLSGIFGHTPLKKGQIPQALKDYEGKTIK